MLLLLFCALTLVLFPIVPSGDPDPVRVPGPLQQLLVPAAGPLGPHEPPE